MNKVFFRAEEIPMPLWTKAAGSFIQSVLETLGHKNWELSVLFCTNRFIKTLNAQYRNKDEATDVLSFSLGETIPMARGRCIAGDIVISLDALEENARFFNVSADEELRRLLVHGILHLAGEDHETNGAKEPMLKTQEKILAALALERISPFGPCTERKDLTAAGQPPGGIQENAS
jgi:probable rRNA maturation factor